MRRVLLALIAIAPVARAADAGFREHVWPVFEAKCVKCHGAEKQKGDLRLDSREAALKGGETGPALVPGKPEESLLVKLVHHADKERTMPPKEKLKPAEIAYVEDWIKAGAPWPKLERAKAAPAVSGEKIGDAWSDPRNPIVQIFKGERLDLWSLKPLRDTPPPRAGHPIDAFLDTAPAPPVDARTLIRRLTFDLTGLPPTPEEVEAFAAAPIENRKSTIDNLLSSPRYGEHWARLWLDAVRYSDSNGFDWDEFRPLAWRFRDYVIRSLNTDKPFDRFVREQLAGDELAAAPPADAAEQDALIATGYLRLGPWDNSAGGFGEQERVRHQWMNDLVETTGAAFLGLTMSCARCHDHKTDPISHADYYRLRAFFEPLKFRDDRPLDLPPDYAAIAAHNAEVEKKLAPARQRRTATLDPAKARLREKRKDDEKKEVSDEDAQKELTKEEKVDYEKADKEVQAVKKEMRAFTTGLGAGDAEDPPKPTRVFEQGMPGEPREEVVPGFLSALDPNPAAVAAREKSTGRRSTLADWIVSPSNPLTARVIVNRVWQAYFGTGLVATAQDFGLAGARPSHPELLDWLAREFVRSGWSLKKLHRLIVTSAAYQRAAPPRRLSAEQLRDAMLAVGDQLQPCAGGAPRWPALPDEVLKANPAFLDDNKEKTKGWYPSPSADLRVRSVFLVQKRTVRVPFMETFDLPDNATPCARRANSTVPPQAFALLNNPFAIECAQAFAGRLEREAGADPAAQIDRAFALALQRAPDPEERAACLRLRESRSLAELCRVVLNLNEFIYVD